MKTPYGKECQYYYADYYRGKDEQHCRLIEANPESAPWKPALCQNCPVPDIRFANACPNLILHAHVGKSLLGLLQKVEIEPRCSQYHVAVTRPKVGCGHCHEVLQSERSPK